VVKRSYSHVPQTGIPRETIGSFLKSFLCALGVLCGETLSNVLNGKSFALNGKGTQPTLRILASYRNGFAFGAAQLDTKKTSN
jgi:hypothetical protein